MLRLKVNEPIGLLCPGWSTEVDEYAVAGGWILDGKALMVCDAIGGVYAFDGESGQSVWVKRGVHGGGLLTAAIHPDGTLFATAGEDGRVLVWNAADGQISQTIEVGKGWVENVVWSPDGQLLGVSCSRTAHVYDADGAEVWRSEAHPSTISAIVWSHKGELGTACYGQVRFFDVPTGKVRQTFTWKGSLVSMVLSPDGEIVACGSQDKSVHFWRRSTGQDSYMGGYPTKPSLLAFDDTGIFLATSGGSAAMVWSFLDDGPEGTRPGVLDLHDNLVTALTFEPNAMCLASGCRDGVVVLWSLDRDGSGEPVGAALVMGAVSKLCWRPDGEAFAALDAQGTVTVWPIADL